MNLGDQMDGVIKAFHAAALGQEDWLKPLAMMAEVTSTSSGELIAVGRDGSVPIHLITNLDSELYCEFFALDGANPILNPRIRAGVVAPELAVIGEADFATEDDLRSPLYALFQRNEIFFSVQTSLIHQSKLTIGLSAMRGFDKGALSDDQRAVFAALAPHVQAAVRTRLALEDQNAAVVAGVMDTVSFAVMVCDRSGLVRSLSPRIEQMLRTGDYFSLSGGVLTTYVAAEGALLKRRIRQAALASASLPPPPRFMTITGRRGKPPLMIEVAPMPSMDSGPFFDLGALVIIREPQQKAEQAAALASAMFGLTPAEAAIAGDLVAGLSAEQISDARRITVGTVRTHIRHILAKAGVGRQIELVGLINARL
jgi:DNA-binding CsgD family transcriptional regulator